jgi:hypothetical protein
MRKLMLVTALIAVSAVGVVVTASSGATRSAPTAKQAQVDPAFAVTLSRARLATAKYATSLAAAKADGYQIITKMIPDMGYHFVNPKVQGFDIRRPPILVYEHSGSSWRLGALEWVFPTKPAAPPVPGAKYGAFPAACHYADGTYVPAAAQTDCAATAPGSGAKFSSWHPALVTMHIWLWYPNPLGIFSGVNPLARPYDLG